MLVISLVGGIINSFVDNFGSLKKYISYFLCLIMVICMLSPLTEVIGSASNLKYNIASFFDRITDDEALNGTNEIIVNTGIDAVKKGIKNTLIEKYGFDEKEIIVDIETDTTNIEAIKITKIKIILTGKASWSDVDSVKDYLKNIVGGDISVTRR
ncbi:MAG: stage III sporulation protein AF [Clostridia bacterium]|nr:stage III sporulation protein AF [Clostridia bacterium]